MLTDSAPGVVNPIWGKQPRERGNENNSTAIYNPS